MQIVSAAAEKLGREVFLVGGFVRDKILDRNTKDADFVCLGDAIELAEEVASGFRPKPKVEVFKNFGTAHIRLREDLDIEFVGARKESYRSHSRKPDVEPGSIRDDQERRDFTINAMAFSLDKKDFGALIDPFNGMKDLDDKIIRTPLMPEQTFSDDPLRMRERFIQFAINYPELMKRVPQRRLASYLHIKPETFTRLKPLLKNINRI